MRSFEELDPSSGEEAAGWRGADGYERLGSELNGGNLELRPLRLLRKNGGGEEDSGHKGACAYS